MGLRDIQVKGAREHNLRNVSLSLPRNHLICFTGVSGSGKSSLAFDTLYAEGQRRYIESLSSYARQFLGQLPKPEVDYIRGLSPSISIAQKTTGQNPRSTVGTITEIYDYLRLLYARVGTGYCPVCGRRITAQTRLQIMSKILQLPEGTRLLVLAPKIRGQKGEFKDLFTDLSKQGFLRVRVDSQVLKIGNVPPLDRQMKHNVDVVVDRIILKSESRSRLAEAVEIGLRVGGGGIIIMPDTQREPDGRDEGSARLENVTQATENELESQDFQEFSLSSEYACTECGLSFEPPTAQMFSFNSPQGMCEECHGLGIINTIDPQKLISDPKKSIIQGCVELMQPWESLNSWRKSIYQSVASYLEKEYGLKRKSLLETPWEDLPEEVRDKILWGTGQRRIKFTQSYGRVEQSWTDTYEGIIPSIMLAYRSSTSRAVQRNTERYMADVTCGFCKGERLNPQARTVRIATRNLSYLDKGTLNKTSIHADVTEEQDQSRCVNGKPKKKKKRGVKGSLNPEDDRSTSVRTVAEGNTETCHEKEVPTSLSLPELCQLSITEVTAFFKELELDETQAYIAHDILHEVRTRLSFLEDVGLGYLSLGRTAPTLSGGEMQRIRLAGQIGSGLMGVLYILDEPSIGLHARDNHRLLNTLEHLRSLGNTVVVVEHDEDTIRSADMVVDFGPGAGVRGGEIVASGTVEDIIQSKKSVTGQFLSGKRNIPLPVTYRSGNGKYLRIRGASHHNLRGIDVEIPLGKFVCITGVSGSGKSSLVNGILVEALNRDLNRGYGMPGAHQSIEGLESLNKLISIDQSPIGKTPRSNPATYIKLFDEIRNLFSDLPEARLRGFKPGRFSFNVPGGGRCEACQGHGATKLEMDFLADVWVTCPVCEGKRFNRETLQVQFKGCSISDVLEMDVQEALIHFQNVPSICRKLETLQAVGLDYMKLGQPSPTLSGGEAQRIKLARELVKIPTGRTIYILDEPTTGLHFSDISMLLKVLHSFADAGNTVLVVEHNLDVIKTADWIIDLGPEGGKEGGQIIASGTPQEIAQVAGSYTGAALRAIFQHVQSSQNELRSAYINPDESATGRKSGKCRVHQRTLSRGSKKNCEISDSPSANVGIESPCKEAACHCLEVLPPLRKKIPLDTSYEDERVGLIHVQGVTEHNLKNITLDIPHEKMTVCCGPSGSGKSSLAMDTIYAEGQRRYVESLSSYARQFVGQMQKPQVERIEGLSPAVAIEQKKLSNSPRSTVGTITEIYDYLRVLMSRLGTPYCPDCQIPVGSQTSDQITDRIMSYPPGTRLYFLAPLVISGTERYETRLDELRRAGYVRVRINGIIYETEDVPEHDRRKKNEVEIVVDRVIVQPRSRSRISESVEQALELGHGIMRVLVQDEKQPESRWKVETHSQHYACERCGRSFSPLSPHNFSFNSALGWCPSCEGLGVQRGANPFLLIKDPRLTLSQGAIMLWAADQSKMAKKMLEAFCTEMEIPTDIPYSELAARHRRILQRGTGERWYDVYLEVGESPEEFLSYSPDGKCSDSEKNMTDSSGVKESKKTSEKKTLGRKKVLNREETEERRLFFRFQYKGLGPVVEGASRMVPSLRMKLESHLDEVPCAECGGSRLRDDAAAVRLKGCTLDEICDMPLNRVLSFFNEWKPSPVERKIAGEILRELRNRLKFLTDVGVEYLSLGRRAPTLSGGEMQRIRLAAQVGSGLTGVLYVLDEPTIGLHPRDNRRLINALYKLRDLGNTLLVVEHDRDVLLSADRLIDFGPGAGKHGGYVMGEGAPQDLMEIKESLTGAYLSGNKTITIPENRRMPSVYAEAGYRKLVPDPPGGGWLEVKRVSHHNLKNIDVKIPLGTLSVVAGVSGSGKSSLVEDVLYPALARLYHRAGSIPGKYESIHGMHLLNKVIQVNQQPLGQTPNSNPATYTGVFDHIRNLFAMLPEARKRGFSSRRFSFNVPGGRCEKCEGNGQIKIEMHFLADVWVTCDSCKGQRYDEETLSIRFHGYNIADVLNLTCAEALQLFSGVPSIRRMLQTLCDVGLDYITLGQPAPTLSGGEAQRVKLAAELSRPDTGKTLYILDEPTTGLHFQDMQRLLDVLNRLVDLGNTVLIIEHNIDVLKVADWVIELGPEAGNEGGYLVACGTPEDLVRYAQSVKLAGKKNGAISADTTVRSGAAVKKYPEGMSGLRSYTGEILESALKSGSYAPRNILSPSAKNDSRESYIRLDRSQYVTREKGDDSPSVLMDNDLEMSDMEEDRISQVLSPLWVEDGKRWHFREGTDTSPMPAVVPHQSPVPVMRPRKWDTRMLRAITDYVEQYQRNDVENPPLLDEILWNTQNSVLVHQWKKPWNTFMRLDTQDEWILRLTCGVPNGTFREEELISTLNLCPLNDLPAIPLYGTRNRTTIQSLGPAMISVELRLLFWEEVNRPEFWKFLEQAILGFRTLVSGTDI